MNKRYAIQVRNYCGNKFVVVKTVQRVLRAEQIGNFNPLFCTYAGNNRCLVQSEEGDLSDPFRRTASYVRSFYILNPVRRQQ